MREYLKPYYCNGMCERCKKRKWFNKGRYYSCDPEKIKGLKIVYPRRSPYPY